MAKIRGKDLYLNFGGVTLASPYGSGNETEMYRKFDYDTEAEMIDVSAGSLSNKKFITGLRSGTGKLEFLVETTDTAIRAAVVEGSYGTLTWGERGTATGAPKGSVMAYVSKFSESIEYDSEVAMTVEFQFSGAFISDPRSATW